MASPQFQVDNRPFGKWTSTLDSGGRLKLGASIQKYIQSQQDTRLYVTAIEDDVITIYPAAIWHHNMRVMQEEFEDPGVAEEMEFLANAQGATAEMDSQGRVGIPARLREEFKLDGEPLVVVCPKGRIDVMRESVFKQKEEEMKTRKPINIREARKKGWI